MNNQTSTVVPSSIQTINEMQDHINGLYIVAFLTIMLICTFIIMNHKSISQLWKSIRDIEALSYDDFKTQIISDLILSEQIELTNCKQTFLLYSMKCAPDQNLVANLQKMHLDFLDEFTAMPVPELGVTLRTVDIDSLKAKYKLRIETIRKHGNAMSKMVIDTCNMHIAMQNKATNISGSTPTTLQW